MYAIASLHWNTVLVLQLIQAKIGAAIPATTRHGRLLNLRTYLFSRSRLISVGDASETTVKILT